MQVVGVGFIISIIEDACETALNSSSDVLFTATAEYARRARMGTLKAEDMVPKEMLEEEEMKNWGVERIHTQFYFALTMAGFNSPSSSYWESNRSFR